MVHPNNVKFKLESFQRRFLNLMLAIGFNICCFAYLFAQPFYSNFQWINQIPSVKNAVLFSLANSFSTNYNSVQSITNIGQALTLIETFISFIR